VRKNAKNVQKIAEKIPKYAKIVRKYAKIFYPPAHLIEILLATEKHKKISPK
jgi:hypothetical protein